MTLPKKIIFFPLFAREKGTGELLTPSYYEGLPIALLEALSYGLPVLVSDIPQHQELPLPDFRYFQKGDVAHLAQTMESLFHKGISLKERKKYFDLLQREYNWDRIAKRILETYHT